MVTIRSMCSRNMLQGRARRLDTDLQRVKRQGEIVAPSGWQAHRSLQLVLSLQIGAAPLLHVLVHVAYDLAQLDHAVVVGVGFSRKSLGQIVTEDTALQRDRVLVGELVRAT